MLTFVSMVMVAAGGVVPLGVTDAGLIVQVAFSGAPEQARLTASLNPPAGVTVIVEVTLLPLAVPEAGDRPRVKPGATAEMVTETAADVEVANVSDPP